MSKLPERLDEIDKRIVYRLMQNARETTTPEIAEEVNVSPGTIRNRIKQLEEKGILRGYHADVDFQRAGKLLVVLIKCSSSVKDRQNLAKKSLQIQGVTQIREIISGDVDLHIKAIAEHTEEVTRIANELIELGLDIKDEDLIRREYYEPYEEFGPGEIEPGPIIDLKSISGEAETADMRVNDKAPVSGKTVEEINNAGLLEKEDLFVAIERENETLTPRGNTTVKAGDIVTIFSPTGISSETLQAFGKEMEEPES